MEPSSGLPSSSSATPAAAGVVVVPASRALRLLLTRLRDRRTAPLPFKQHADRLMALLAEEVGHGFAFWGGGGRDDRGRGL